MISIYHRHTFRKVRTPSNVRTDLGNMKTISQIIVSQSSPFNVRKEYSDWHHYFLSLGPRAAALTPLSLYASSPIFTVLILIMG